MAGEYEEIMAGDALVRRIRVRPDWQMWDDDPILTAHKSWMAMKTKMEYFLRGWVGDYEIDEVALMFEGYEEEAMFGFVKDAVRDPGVKLFNSAWDHVETAPIFSEYDVEYCFLEVDYIPMRVEVMRIDRGDSPLHSSLMGRDFLNYTLEPRPGHTYGPIAVHFSFKVEQNQYETVRAAMVSGGAELAQSCESTYGRFAYYRLDKVKEDLDFPANVYLKPRINTRDEDRGDFGMPTIGRPIKDAPQA